jgi:hypothetical protein
MKKNLKINNKLKLNLGINKTWELSNFQLNNIKNMQTSIKILQNVHCLFLFYGRSINFFFRYYFFQSFFRRCIKILFFRQKTKLIKFLFFFKRIIKKKQYFFFFLKKVIKKKKKFFLSTLLNFFSSVHCSFSFFKNNTNFIYLTLTLNLCFYSNKKYNFFNKKVIIKKIIQKLFFSSFKYFIEKFLQKLLNFPIILNLRFLDSLNIHYKILLHFLQKYKYQKLRLRKFSNFRLIKTLHKVQKDIISNLILAFYCCNAKLIAEQFSLGINRTRKQKQFVWWFNSLIKYYKNFGFNIASIKIIIFGKMAGKPRTQITKLQYGKFTVKTQTLALKVQYGYASAETYTGTFGIHVWIYQRNIIPDLMYLKNVQ